MIIIDINFIGKTMKKFIISIVIKTKYYFGIITQIIPKGLYTRFQYRFKYRRFPNLKKPILFSEKLQVIKLKKPTVDEILVSNKYYLKQWLECLGFSKIIIKPIDYQTNIKNLKWDEYPLPFIVKVANGSSQHVVCKSKLEINSKKRVFEKIAKIKHYIAKREYTYKYLEKGFIVEPYLVNDSHSLDDYKVHCFNGEPLYIQINDRSSKSNRMMIDSDFKYYSYPFVSGHESSINLPEKKYLIEMMDISKKISAYFDFARCDFYIHANRVYLGEITLYPMGGYVLQKSHSIDKLWGSLLKLH